MNPLVSVIIPTWNRYPFLTEAITSIQRQTYSHVELIVVDDGSADATPWEIPSRFPSVVFLRQPHRGVSAARNLGIRHARGEYIAFLDSDDLWLPKKLEREITCLSENPSYRICYTDEIWIRRGMRVNPKKKHRKYGGWIYPHCLPLCIISPSSVILHREVFETVGGFDESLPACEDYDLWLRITARFKVWWIDAPLIIKRGGHADQLSRAFWGMDRFRIRALVKILNEDILSEPWRQKTLEELEKKCYILIQGAEKRGKMKNVTLYRQILQTFLPHSFLNPLPNRRPRSFP